MRNVEVGTKFVEPGLCDSPPHVDHRLSIHVGRPVASVCWEGRPRPRYVRTPGGINIVPAGAPSRWLIESPMQQLSEVAGTSVSCFKAAFKQTFGTPVHRYVVERRVERAARLLAKGQPISAVAAEVGFAHASHMARWMQRLLRATPGELKLRSS